MSAQHSLWRLPASRARHPAVSPGAKRADGRLARPGAAASSGCGHVLRWCRSSTIDIVWVGFVGLNLAAPARRVTYLQWLPGG